MTDVFCKKCGLLVSPYDFDCPECGNPVAEAKCYLCGIDLDRMNKFTCHRQDLADGRIVLSCTKCKAVYEEGIRIAESRGIKIENPKREEH